MFVELNAVTTTLAVGMQEDAAAFTPSDSRAMLLTSSEGDHAELPVAEEETAASVGVIMDLGARLPIFWEVGGIAPRD